MRFSRYFPRVTTLILGYFLYDHYRREKLRVRVIDRYRDPICRLKIVHSPPFWITGSTVRVTECTALDISNSKKFIEENSHKLDYDIEKKQYPVFEHKKAYSFFYKIIQPPFY